MDAVAQTTPAPPGPCLCYRRTCFTTLPFAEDESSRIGIAHCTSSPNLSRSRTRWPVARRPCRPASPRTFYRRRPRRPYGDEPIKPPTKPPLKNFVDRCPSASSASRGPSPPRSCETNVLARPSRKPPPSGSFCRASLLLSSAFSRRKRATSSSSEPPCCGMRTYQECLGRPSARHEGKGGSGEERRPDDVALRVRAKAMAILVRAGALLS